MKRFLYAMLMLALPLSLSAFELKISTMYPDGTAAVNSLKAAGEKIAKETDGRVTLRIYAGGVMGDDAAVQRRIRIGQLHGTLAQAGAFTRYNKDSQVLNLPLIFHDAKEVAHVRKQLDPVLRKGFKDNGWTVFGPIDGGFAYFMTKQPVASVADLRQQKVWLPANDPASEMAAKEFNVSPVVLNISAVLTSLQTGAINAFAAPPIAALTLQWFSRVEHLTDLPLLYTYALLGIEDRHLQRLSKDDRAVLERVLTDTVTAMDKKEMQDNKNALQAVLGQGLQLVKPSEDEKEEWRAYANRATKKLVQSDQVSQQMLDKVTAILNEYRQ
ncbi:MAG TPA: TRAP transporter substrate-binding protein DctP [Alcanivoracaceae bacterium]|nr:TRAP transporter substrate-binding protein DctP [Alcanivoracaceae bacterium]